MSVPVTRIFSDLHFRDGESRLHDLRAFAPLLAGADRIVLNGDTLDSQADADGSDLAGIRSFFAQHAPPTTFLSGNHDPDISPHGELLLNDGRVWITHGDVLFDDIAPWSSLRAEMAGRLELLFAAVPPEERALLETRLRLHRLACRGLPEHHDRLDRTVFTRASRLAHILFPPHRLLTMLRVWRETP
ncbi:MAG TPA: metallophosphoesterase, partial [Rariglobus sp.]